MGSVARAESFEKLEKILKEDLPIVQKYFKSWYLTLNSNKTTFIVFHLNNRESDRKLNLETRGINLKWEDAPKYLGIKLDRTLVFKKHLEGVKNKLKTKNNTISKQVGTSKRCRENILCTSALALVYNTTEYCAPVWGRSVHMKKFDVELNNTMRIITGCLQSMKVQRLPVLSSIIPPEICRYVATVKILQQIQKYRSNKKLKSRHRIWSIGSTTDI